MPVRKPVRAAWLPIVLGMVLPGPVAADGLDPLPNQPAGAIWPTERWPEAALEADAEAVRGATERLFSYQGRAGLPDTRGLLVVHRGAVVHERYAEGFDAASCFRSWSAAKSVTQAMLARLVVAGRLRIDDPAPVPEWQGPNDPRRVITIRNLLHMNSGLDNADGGAEMAAFVARLIFGRDGRDSAAFAAQARLVHRPGTHWAYSTASSQILSRVIAREVGGGRAGMLAWIERELARPLGLDSLVVEFDPSGTPIGGGFVWMNARDWARLGLLYLRDGVWNGDRLLPEGWVDLTRTAAPAENNGVYGAHFWVSGEPGENQPPTFPRSLGDSFQMSGNAGQFVVMFPSRDLILVRLGEMHTISWRNLVDELGEIAGAFAEIAP